MGTEDEVWEGSQFSERCWDSNYHNADHNEVFHSGYTVDGNTSPLSFIDCLKMLLWLLVPVANIILPIVWAVGGDKVNLNKRNFWRAYLIILLISIVFCVLIGVLVISVAGVSILGGTNI